MAWLVKTLLIWLLVLAVPAQGAAAATMVFCGPDHHGGGAALAQATATDGVHAHHGHAMPAHSMHASDSGDPAAVTVAGDATVAADASPAASQTCSACASCCSLGAMLSALPVVPVTDLAPAMFTAGVPSVDAFAVDGPDRPPRSVLV